MPCERSIFQKNGFQNAPRQTPSSLNGPAACSRCHTQMRINMSALAGRTDAVALCDAMLVIDSVAMVWERSRPARAAEGHEVAACVTLPQRALAGSRSPSCEALPYFSATYASTVVTFRGHAASRRWHQRGTTRGKCAELWASKGGD